ncbi:MAG: DUF937 domain-containing protein [Hyphomicrobiaceae bacterium]
MSSSSIVDSPEGQRFARALATEFGIGDDAARSAMAALLPGLVRGIEHNTLTRKGVADLMAALASGGHASVIDDPSRIASTATVADGNAILGHIVGAPALSRNLALGAERSTGISSAILKKMLPMLAVFVLGWIFKNGRGVLADVVERLPQSGGMAGGAGSVPGLPGGSSRAGGEGDGPLTLPDLDTVRRGRSAQSDNPYGDITDILRGGKGSSRPGGSGGAPAGDLADVIRDVLGGLLGFKNRSWLSWLIGIVIYRYGWQILKFVLGRLLFR